MISCGQTDPHVVPLKGAEPVNSVREDRPDFSTRGWLGRGHLGEDRKAFEEDRTQRPQKRIAMTTDQQEPMVTVDSARPGRHAEHGAHLASPLADLAFVTVTASHLAGPFHTQSAVNAPRHLRARPVPRVARGSAQGCEGGSHCRPGRVARPVSEQSDPIFTNTMTYKSC